jgi:putative DNA-invertase from lambdoid prophage Rac
MNMNSNTKQKAVVLYGRISTTEQSHDSQLTELREYASRRDWTQVEEIVDTVSGATSSRKGLDRLMALVRRGKIDIVAVYKLDRLGRSLSHLAGMIDEFSSHGVGLISVSQGIDTSANNAMAKMQLGMLSVFAEFERDLIRERTVAGLRVARNKGKTLGRPRKIDSYSSRVAELWGQGLSKRAIAKTVGVAPSNVMRLLAKAA